MFERDIAATGAPAPPPGTIHAKVNAQAGDLFEARWHENREAHPYAIEMWPHIDALTGLFRDVPAICVGTGPSVTRTLPSIAEVASRVITIACPSAVKYCVGAGFAPTFVPFVEPTFVRPIAESFPPASNIVLDYRAHDAYYDLNAIQRFVFGHETDKVAQRAKRLCRRRTLFPECPSSLGTCFSLAVMLGCHPVVIAGADFSFDGDEAHPPDHYAKLYGKGEETWEFVGVDGRPCRANWIMLAYRDWFQSWVKRYLDVAAKAKRQLAVIDATPRGLGVPGATRCENAPALLAPCVTQHAVQSRIDEAALASTMFAHALTFERQILELAA